METRRRIGWLLVGGLWGAALVRLVVFPADLHGDYPASVQLFNMAVDLVLFMPLWLIWQRVAGPHADPGLFWIVTLLYLLAISTLIYLLCIRGTHVQTARRGNK